MVFNELDIIKSTKVPCFDMSPVSLHLHWFTTICESNYLNYLIIMIYCNHVAVRDVYKQNKVTMH